MRIHREDNVAHLRAAAAAALANGGAPVTHEHGSSDFKGLGAWNRGRRGRATHIYRAMAGWLRWSPNRTRIGFEFESVTIFFFAALYSEDDISIVWTQFGGFLILNCSTQNDIQLW